MPRIAAIAIAVACVLMGVLYLRFAGDDGGSSRAIVPGGGYPVVVAATDIPAGTRLTAEMLEVEFVAEDAPESMPFGRPHLFIDQVTKVRLAKGERVTVSKLVSLGP